MVWVTLAGLLTPVAAEGNEGSEEAAQLHLERGVAAFEARDLARAHRELTAARELAPHKPNPYRWLALTEVQLGDCAHALANIDAFNERALADDPRRAELDRLRELCARGGAVTITSTPAAAAIRVDGKLAGTTPATLSMREGHHAVTIEKSGYEPYTHNFDMTVVGDRRFSFDLVVRRARTPIYRRWWFWTAAGAAVVAVAGIAILASGDDANTLPPIHCNTQAGCLP